MLGMMNSSATDSFEFYASNNNREDQLSEEDRKTFTEVKTKASVSYTTAGKRLINGQSTEDINAHQLWENVIRKSNFSLAINKKEKKAQKTSEENEDEDGTLLINVKDEDVNPEEMWGHVITKSLAISKIEETIDDEDEDAGNSDQEPVPDAVTSDNAEPSSEATTGSKTTE